jgi:hypothetical protein
MNLRQAAEMALEALKNAEVVYMEQLNAMYALQEALAEPEDPRIVELTTLMAEPGVTGVIFEVHRGPLSKSIREFGECPCPTHVDGDVRIEVKEEREWVGLTKEDFYKKDDETVFVLGMKFAEARLKEKNT